MLGQQVLASHAQMHATSNQFIGNLGRREKRNGDVVHARQLCSVVARAAGLDKAQSGVGQILKRLFLQAALGGNGDDESAHAAPPCRAMAAASRSQKTARPIEGVRFGAPSAESKSSYRPPPAIGSVAVAARISKTKPV